MSRRSHEGRSPAVILWTLALVAGGAGTLSLLGAADAEPGPVIDPTVRAHALASEPPGRPTMSDEIEHFEARSRSRPHESFARERLFHARMLAFRAYGEIEHLDRAGELVEAMQTADGRDDAASLRASSSLQLAEHDFKQAVETARRLRKVSHGDVATYRLFDALWAAGARDEATVLLEGPLDTLSTAYLSRRARVLDARGLVEPARDLFRRVVETVEAYAEPAPVRAWALVELGHFELHSGSPRAAVRRYEEALEVLPGSPAALEGLASVAYGVDRDPTAAAALYRRALENGAHLDVVPVLADIEESLGDRQTAERLRRTFVGAARRDARSEAMHRRPLVFLLAEAPSTLREAQRLARADLADRQDPGAFDALAWVLYRMGDAEMAWTLQERALAAGAAPPPILFRAGLIAEAAGETGPARDLLEEALEGEVELAPHEVEAAEASLARLHP